MLTMPRIVKFPLGVGTALVVTMRDDGPDFHIERGPLAGDRTGGSTTPGNALALAETLLAAYSEPSSLVTNEAMRPVPFFLVWSPTGLRPPRHRHSSREDADTEATRLAGSNAGGEFYTLAPVSMVKLPSSPVREEYAYSTEDGRPF